MTDPDVFESREDEFFDWLERNGAGRSGVEFEVERQLRGE